MGLLSRRFVAPTTHVVVVVIVGKALVDRRCIVSAVLSIMVGIHIAVAIASSSRTVWTEGIVVVDGIIVDDVVVVSVHTAVNTRLTDIMLVIIVAVSIVWIGH